MATGRHIGFWRLQCIALPPAYHILYCRIQVKLCDVAAIDWNLFVMYKLKMAAGGHVQRFNLQYIV